MGFHFSNHDLRRTCGRMMHRAGVGIEQIARIFGHVDTGTTMHYLGLNLDDQDEAMMKLAQFQNSLLFLKRKSWGRASKSGGPKEIWTLDLPVISRALQPG